MKIHTSKTEFLESEVKRLSELLQAQPAPVQEPVAWMEMVVANLVREGVNKHKARELAEHFYTIPPAAQRTWVGLMRGVRVDGDTVVISVKGGNDEARELCGALLMEKNT
jgi:hypothetical protein